ncbi:MAG: Txe/YoeB family addiction module toxin [Gammaproteobacteria bacterium]|nr:MAG: Txe/YoeB family addiction module toxin [Gammaproteobacteria bacterium]
MSYTIRFTKAALSDIEKHKKSGDQATLRKIQQLLTELLTHPRTGTGQPELLKYDLKGMYSRKINRKHRLVYDIKDKIVTVIVLSAYSHYGDK